MKVAIYARLSKDKSGLLENVDIQIRECKTYARSMGYRIAGVFLDNDMGASKFSRKPRPGYQTLLTAIRTNLVEAVLITEMPRLYRRLDELLGLIKLAEQTNLKHIITIDEAGYDLSTGQGIHNAVSAVRSAMLESRRTSDRMKRKIRAKARDGAGHGGRRPYGYELGWMALREDEAQVIRWMVKRVIAGETINGVVKQLNEQGIPTATGKMWHHTLVRQVLTRPRIVGIRSHNGTTYEGAFPAVITVGEWELLQLSLAKLRRVHTGGVQQGRKYLLTGLVYCGNCGQPMTGGAHHGSREAHSKPRYRCENRAGLNLPRCGKVIRLAEPVDLLVTDAVLYALDTVNLSDLLYRDGKPQTKSLLEQYQRLQRRQRDLVDDYASGLLTRAELAQAKATVEAQIEQVQSQLTQLQPQRALELLPAGQKVREAWKEGSLTLRKMILSLLIERVVIKPTASSYSFYHGYRFSPQSVEILWKH